MEAKEVNFSAVLLNSNGESDLELGSFVQDVLESNGFKPQMVFFDEGRINQDITDNVLKIRPRVIVVNMPFPYEQYKRGIKEFTESLDKVGITVILATDGEFEALRDFKLHQYSPNVFHLVKPFEFNDLTQVIQNAPNPK